MGEPNINTMGLIDEGGYGKTDNTLSSRIFVDQLYEGAELYSFQFELSVSESFNFDSLHSSIDISDVVSISILKTNVLKVARAPFFKKSRMINLLRNYFIILEVIHNLKLKENLIEPVSDRYKYIY